MTFATMNNPNATAGTMTARERYAPAWSATATFHSIQRNTPITPKMVAVATENTTVPVFKFFMLNGYHAPSGKSTAS
jgi:hypothetical protein